MVAGARARIDAIGPRRGSGGRIVSINGQPPRSSPRQGVAGGSRGSFGRRRERPASLGRIHGGGTGNDGRAVRRRALIRPARGRKSRLPSRNRAHLRWSAPGGHARREQRPLFGKRPKRHCWGGSRAGRQTRRHREALAADQRTDQPRARSLRGDGPRDDRSRAVAAPDARPGGTGKLSLPISEPISPGPALSEVTDHVTTEVARQPGPADGMSVTKHDEAERRQITVMSCEAIGLAARADGIGLEDLFEAIGAFQHCVSEIVGRHSGFIASRLGNTVLVLFGYPAAHEHDAEQAIRAGLELCAAVRTLRPDADLPMRCRVGIATGMVIVGDFVGVGEVRDHGIVGDAPNLAVRLQVSAQADTVTIEPTTWRLIGNLFDCRDLGALDANDDSEPIHRWQVLGESIVASRFEALRGSKLTRLVGRDEEIGLLLRRWASVKAGDGQIILVSGEAGLGKSRATAALEERLHGEPHLRLRYFCSPYHQDSALFPIIDQLGRAAGFARDDAPALKLEKLEALLARTAPPDEDVALLADL